MMQLAATDRRIAGQGQLMGERRREGGQVIAITPAPVGRRQLPAHQALAPGNADRTRRIGVFKDNGLLRQTVQDGGSDNPVSHVARHVVPVLVGHQEQDVRRAFGQGNPDRCNV